MVHYMRTEDGWCNMKLLVFSDSHGCTGPMKAAIGRERPHAVIHLGDFWADGESLKEDFPNLPIYQVPGNCDQGRVRPGAPEILVRTFHEVPVYMTHGHLHHVKWSLLRLKLAAQESGARVVLYGHTHRSHCQQLGQLWLVNPWTCGGNSGTYAILTIKNETVVCEICSLRSLEQGE